MLHVIGISQNTTEDKLNCDQFFIIFLPIYFDSRIKLHFLQWYDLLSPLSAPIYGPFGLRHQLFYDIMWCYAQAKDRDRYSIGKKYFNLQPLY